MLTSTSGDSPELEAAWAWPKLITSGEGAADVANTTGSMPPDPAADEIILADLYEENPTEAMAVRRIGLVPDSHAYPGDDGLALTQVVRDDIERVVTGEEDGMEALRQELTEEVRDPRRPATEPRIPEAPSRRRPGPRAGASPRAPRRPDPEPGPRFTPRK